MRRALIVVALVIWSVVVFFVGGAAIGNVEGGRFYSAGFVKGVEVCEVRHQGR